VVAQSHRDLAQTHGGVPLYSDHSIQRAYYWHAVSLLPDTTEAAGTKVKLGEKPRGSRDSSKAAQKQCQECHLCGRGCLQEENVEESSISNVLLCKRKGRQQSFF